MFDMINTLIADAAYDAAIYSVGLASTGGAHQPVEPKMLQDLAENN